jgi:hypothetical protein
MADSESPIEAAPVAVAASFRKLRLPASELLVSSFVFTVFSFAVIVA